jgi:hypothetical protein
MHVKTTLSGFVVGWSLVIAAAVAAAGTPDKAKPAEKQALCELRIEGQSIESLTLDGAPGPFERPGKVLHLPAGWYLVSEVILEGGYQHDAVIFFPRKTSEERWFRANKGAFELTPEQPYTLKVGGPLLPKAEVTRQGKCLKLSYDLVDAEGRSYRKNDNTDRSSPPRFKVCKGEREIGSGTFEYG